MQGTQHGSSPRFSVTWEAGRTRGAADSIDHAAHYAMALAHALTSAGYPPNRLEISVQEPSPVQLELEVNGDVPGLDQTSFGSLARIAVSGCRIWQALPTEADVRVRATLAGAPPAAALPAPTYGHGPLAQGASAPDVMQEREELEPRGGRTSIVAMVVLLSLVALVLLVGHPPGPANPPPLPTAVAVAGATAMAEAPSLLAPESLAPPGAVSPSSGVLRTVLDERFDGRTTGWLDNPAGPAWFGAGGYRMLARDPGQFVAVSVPLGLRVTDVVLSAVFEKTGGPDGGTYGLVLRAEPDIRLDGELQTGHYLVFEVSDRGEIGVWQREAVRWIELVPWTRSGAVRSGRASNELIVSDMSQQLTFSVNGQHVTQVASALPIGGAIGVFVGGDLNEVTLSRLLVQAP